MTLTSELVRVAYSGDGSTTSFAVSFVFWDPDDFSVISKVDSTGVETTLTRGTHYTVTGGSGSTGTVEMVTSPTDNTPATGETLTILSALTNTQDTDIPVGGQLDSGAVEQQLDKMVRMNQEDVEELGRSLKFPKADSAALSAEIPNSVDRASKFLAFDASGEPIASTGPTGDSSIPVSSYIETLLDDADSGTALATLIAAGTAIVNTFSATQSWSKGADIASASTLVLGTDGNYFDITGTTGITAITVVAGTLFMLQFDGALTITHNATTLNLPGAANITTAAGDRLVAFSTAANTVHVVSFTKADGTPVVRPSGSVVQVVSVSDGALATGTTVLPRDDTIPQITEGDQYMSLAITPNNTANTLLIFAEFTGESSAVQTGFAIALFQDSTANALAVVATRNAASSNFANLSLKHVMAAGTTSVTTFRIRAGGPAAGTTTFNGVASGRQYGGVMASRMIIMEIKA